MVMAAELSRQMGWMSGEDVDRIRNLLLKANLPVNPPQQLSGERFLDLMAVDKKVIGGRLRLVLLRALGEAIVTSDFEHSALKATLNIT